MKKSVFVPGLIFLVFILIHCEKEPGKDPVTGLRYVKTETGGCNTPGLNSFKRVIEDQSDTAIFTIKNDSLELFVGVNYICCAPFSSVSQIKNDSILITLNDTCNIQSETCYCRCMCYYTWNLKFIILERKEYFYTIILDDPRKESPVIFRFGKLDLRVDSR